MINMRTMKRSSPIPLSIITVCRNDKARVERTHASLLAQDNQDFEWIVIDGASCDGTAELLATNHPRLDRLVSEPDRGLYDAMNKGIGLASGTYLLFLNAGDILHDAGVLTAFQALNPKAELVVGHIRILYPDGQEQIRRIHPGTFTADFLYWRCLPQPTTFFRRSLFERIGTFDLSYRITSDYDFYMRALLEKQASWAILDHCVADFTNDGISARHENRRLLYWENRKVRRRHYSFLYRTRRVLNESWGHLAHRLRKLRITGS